LYVAYREDVDVQKFSWNPFIYGFNSQTDMLHFRDFVWVGSKQCSIDMRDCKTLVTQNRYCTPYFDETTTEKDHNPALWRGHRCWPRSALSIIFNSRLGDRIDGEAFFPRAGPRLLLHLCPATTGDVRVPPRPPRTTENFNNETGTAVFSSFRAQQRW